MAALFASGHVVDAIIAILVIEVLFCLFRWQASALSIVIGAIPGIFLLLALRAALTGASWVWVALWLALSFPAHLLDVWRRRP